MNALSETRPPLRFSIRTMIFGMTALCGVMGVTAYTGRMEIPVGFSVLAIAMLMHRVGNASLAAAVAWAICAFAGILAWLTWFDDLSMILEQLLAMFIMAFAALAALLLFVVGAFQSPKRRTVGVIGAFFSIAVPVFWIIVIHPHLLDSKHAHRTQLAARDAIAMQQIVTDIDALIASLGRVPQSEEELVLLMGKPMPSVHDGFTPVAIEYHPTRGGGYELMFWTYWGNADYYVYESKAPQNGWVPKYD